MLNEIVVEPSFLKVLLAEEGISERALVPRRPVELALRNRVRALLTYSAQENLPILYLGTMSLFDGYRRYPGRICDWVLVNLAEDPMLHDKDGFPIPRQILEHLQEIKQAGIEFDAIYVAHDVRKGTIREGEPLTAELLMPPPPRTVEQLSHKLGSASEALWAVAVTPLAVSAVVGAAVAAGALMVGPALAVAVASCVTGDPILLGTVVAPGRSVRVGEPACWVYLAHWEY